MLVGQHDYTHFASSGNPDPSPIKTIYRLEVLQDTDGYVFQVEGSGFMYKMVCLIVLPVTLSAIFTSCCRLATLPRLRQAVAQIVDSRLVCMVICK